VQTASDRMLRGRSPWGLGRGVYLFVCSFARSSMRGRRCFQLRVGERWNPSRIYEEYIGGLKNRSVVAIYCEGVPTVVVFKISPSRVKTFHYRPNVSTTTTSHLHAVRRLCVGSAEPEGQQVAVTPYRCRVRFRRPS